MAKKSSGKRGKPSDNQRSHPSGTKRNRPTKTKSEGDVEKRANFGSRQRSPENRESKRQRDPEPGKRNRTPGKPSPDSSGFDLLYGKHSVKSVFLQRPQDVEKLILAGKEDYHSELIELAGKNDIPAFLTSWEELVTAGGFGEDDKHQGVLAYVKPREIFSEGDFDRLLNANCILVLDQVSNPQNLATIIRSAAFFHADAVLYMKNRAATPTPEVVRFAVGGAEMIDMYQITNVAQSLEQLKDLGFIVLGLDERGTKTLAQHDLGGKIAFVIGAEGEGLRNKTKNYCSDLVSIPGGMEGVESLNAAVATTIALYEYARLMADETGR